MTFGAVTLERVLCAIFSSRPRGGAIAAVQLAIFYMYATFTITLSSPLFCHTFLFSFFDFHFHFILMCFLLRSLLSASFFLSFLPSLFVFSSSILRRGSRIFSVRRWHGILVTLPGIISRVCAHERSGGKQ
jgi:hypothetical protein